jgi:hypothetical protein
MWPGKELCALVELASEADVLTVAVGRVLSLGKAARISACSPSHCSRPPPNSFTALAFDQPADRVAADFFRSRNAYRLSLLSSLPARRERVHFILRQLLTLSSWPLPARGRPARRATILIPGKDNASAARGFRRCLQRQRACGSAALAWRPVDLGSRDALRPQPAGTVSSRNRF